MKTICPALQDNWFDETDESGEESVGSPVAAAQTWKVHQGLGASEARSDGIVNAAYVDDRALLHHVSQHQDAPDLDAF